MPETAKGPLDAVEQASWQDIVLLAIFHPIQFVFELIQTVLAFIFSPKPPPRREKLGKSRIAIIGAGITGVSAASHCVGHGFECKLFEKGDKDSIGGIWSKVNKTSGLQIHSLMYRFHPSVRWKGGYPDRQQIVDQVRRLWEEYGLGERTQFNTAVEKVYQDKRGRWIINDPSNGRFDGVIAAVGTCGDPKMPHMDGQEDFKGEVHHSSQLDGKSAKGKKVLIVGGGASAIEALEFVAAEGAEQAYILSRVTSEKWIIPRNPFIDMLLALNVFGSETGFSWIPEFLLRRFFYRDLASIAPPPSAQGLFEETPMVNTDVLELVRSGQAKWFRGDTVKFTSNGMLFTHRDQGVPKGGPGTTREIQGDMCIMATGFKRPSLNFLPDECFDEPYNPPNWYLQVFPPPHPDISAINCTYVNAIGTVGNYHIGIYTRFLLMFLVDPLARPQQWLMKTWIDMTRWIKQKAPGGAFDFFTYSELIYWFCFVIVINPFRWKWALFVLFGIGRNLPMSVVQKEDTVRNGWDGKANGKD
ncbi:FAD/NAD(P)-binding domain-containing protein [Eremomyces bilateralis CBS 781.70]|uniref:FAD/NAD(P)-binding domain-containing protein n=1 Tax=Eremomyces bilateralis CBS 781.70 TaxID=1392243 RepID=A0A6G1GEJ5_9PEZI|nr:FAD/NAD(P)-binding domain-containing protein [Eremomyces bilateralis CBS 781.70]KAF1816321.1 FAD/NAD(P)-binding domain-containing protein [Eremomyces bilateralis CBS 781.70]